MSDFARRPKLTAKFKQRLREYKWFANRMKEHGERVMLKGGEIFGENQLPHDPKGLAPEECQFLYESKGEIVPCSDADAWWWVLAGKQMRDWQIGAWARGLIEGTFFWRNLVEDGVPESLVEAARTAAASTYLAERKRLVQANG